MAQRYFLTAESTYEDLRQTLNTQLAYPNALGKSVFQTALYAPRDGFRRVLLAVDTDLPNYAAIDAAIAPLLASDAMEEIDEAGYLAAVASATGGGGGGASSWNDLTGKPSSFPPESHAASHGVGGADQLFDQSLNTTDAVLFSGIEANAGNGKYITLDGTNGIQLAGQASLFGPTTLYGNVAFGDGSINGPNPTLDFQYATVQNLSYNSLTDLPTLFDGAYSSLTGLPTLGTAAAAATTDFAAASHTHTVADLSATGTPSASTFLRGDGAWSAAGSTNASDLTAGTLGFPRLPVRVRASANLYLWSAFR